MTAKPAKGSLYLDYGVFKDGLGQAERDRLAGRRVMFCYPVLDANEFELVEQPVSQRVLMAVARDFGCEIESEVASAGPDGVAFSNEGRGAADLVVIHPMIGMLDRLPALVEEYRRRFPGAIIILQTSDQHQHEKVIGGPRGNEIARHLLDTILGIDWILVGFAEHAFLSLLLGRPTEAVIGHGQHGSEPLRLFDFASLPEPEPAPDAARDRTVRVQRGRGCLSPCTYCIEGQINRTVTGERAWNGLSIEAFIDRVAQAAKQGNFFVTITDSSFEDPGRRGLEGMFRFCDLVIERGLRLSFKIHMRTENMLRLSVPDLDKMKGAGIDVIGCGIESGNADELAFIRKIASKEMSLQAYRQVEEYGAICVILGYLMLSPTSTKETLGEKVEFLRDLNRGWDFLILTNRLLVFWGTVMHRELVALGLIEDGAVQPGYVDYRFADHRVAEVDFAISQVKHQRPEFMTLNNLMFDAINLESRILNPVNIEYRDMIGGRFEAFRRSLADHRGRLTETYCDGMLGLVDDPTNPFLPNFDGQAEHAALQSEIASCLEPLAALPEPPTTLYLHTWMSVVNKFSVKI